MQKNLKEHAIQKKNKQNKNEEQTISTYFIKTFVFFTIDMQLPFKIYAATILIRMSKVLSN